MVASQTRRARRREKDDGPVRLQVEGAGHRLQRVLHHLADLFFAGLTGKFLPRLYHLVAGGEGVEQRPGRGVSGALGASYSRLLAVNCHQNQPYNFSIRIVYKHPTPLTSVCPCNNSGPRCHTDDPGGINRSARDGLPVPLFLDAAGGEAAPQPSMSTTWHTFVTAQGCAPGFTLGRPGMGGYPDHLHGSLGGQISPACWQVPPRTSGSSPGWDTVIIPVSVPPAIAFVLIITCCFFCRRHCRRRRGARVGMRLARRQQNAGTGATKRFAGQTKRWANEKRLRSR